MGMDMMYLQDEIKESENKRFKIVQDPRVQTEYFIYDNENKI